MSRRGWFTALAAMVAGGATRKYWRAELGPPVKWKIVALTLNLQGIDWSRSESISRAILKSKTMGAHLVHPGTRETLTIERDANEWHQWREAMEANGKVQWYDEPGTWGYMSEETWTA